VDEPQLNKQYLKQRLLPQIHKWPMPQESHGITLRGNAIKLRGPCRNKAMQSHNAADAA